MVGRDPLERHRAATPLEALFDLTFAASFSLAASDLASVLAAAHYRAFHAASPKIARDVVSQDFSFNHPDLNHWLDDRCRPYADATAETGLYL